MEPLRQEVQLLRHVLDELREDFSWALRNGVPAPLPSTFHLTSMPADPAAPDWAQRLNRVAAIDLPPVGETHQVEASRLAAALESVEQLTYCCDRPDLQWHGDPDAPGISCAHCGFPVAEEGNLLCWRDAPPSIPDQPLPVERAAPAAPTTARSTQGNLF